MMMLFPPAAPPAAPLFALRVDVKKPQPWERFIPSKRGRFVKMVKPPRTDAMQKLIRQHCHIALRVRGFDADADLETLKGGRQVLSGPLCCLVVSVFPRIKAMPDKKNPGRQWRAVGDDADNLAKLVMDALNKLIYRDDSQIVWLQSRTEYAAEGEHAAIEMYIWAASTVPPQFEGVAALPFNA